MGGTSDNGGSQQGVYRIGPAAALLGVTKRTLPGAVLPAGRAQEPVGTYGWVMGACPSPQKGDRYIVEFVEKNAFRILAYVDRYARVFAVDHPITTPPARTPDLLFARTPDQPDAGIERGAVLVPAESDDAQRPAEYACEHGRYSFNSSWYDFGAYGADLGLYDALARAYLAFVYRPQLFGTEPPEGGIASLFRTLGGKPLLPALRSIADEVRRAEADPALRPPDLARCLAFWLSEAGLDAVLAAVPGDGADQLRLVRTKDTANLLYVAAEDECSVPERAIWALEAALNRFMMMDQEFGDRASAAHMADCGRWDAYLTESVGKQVLDASHPADATSGRAAGEWEFRCGVGLAIERMRLPYRCKASFRADVAAGVAAFSLVVPDAALMPAWRWDDALGGWAAVSPEERQVQAQRYAMRLGILHAAAAFHSAASVQQVSVQARPLSDGSHAGEAEAAGAPAAGFGRPAGAQPGFFYRVTFDRARFCDAGAFRMAAEGDPAPLYRWCGAVLGGPGTADMDDGQPFALVEKMPSAALRRDLPEVGIRPVAARHQAALGAETTRDLRINDSSEMRRTAELLADGIAAAASATESIGLVRAVQEQTLDPRVPAACTRLMTALAEGSVDTSDQNALVSCFMGEDRFLTAFRKAAALADADCAAAREVLEDVLAEAERAGTWDDTAEVVYRTFDSYISRVAYNLVRGGTVPAAGNLAAGDRGKRVELAPDALFYCYGELAKLLERSFDRTDEALRLGMRCISLAPTMALGYRLAARICMLVGDLECARSTLHDCLRAALQPDDIAVAYYQLAYVEWKAGRPQAAIAIYLKSIMTSPVMEPQVAAELRELLEESGMPLTERNEVDAVLEREGVPLAPSEALLDKLDKAASAAVDEGLFAVARNLLLLRLRYRPDDVLTNVLRSL